MRLIGASAVWQIASRGGSQQLGASMRSVLKALCVAVLLCAGLAVSHAENRVALVVGNASYRATSRLANPPNDAGDVAAALRRLGFSVTSLGDVDYDRMRRALLEFSRAAGQAEIAMVYFAGHGIELGGENYLVPVDAELRS
ncbi:caspase domain-containing protein, partial [Rhodoplanes sp. SY1]|uniref:caspase family protein n=1 Tax=Rhodoplanes sp. SY1 TaxID=3166646 RepID=UPI0038B6012E